MAPSRSFSLEHERLAKLGFYFFASGTALSLCFLVLSHYFAWRLGYAIAVWELSELVFFGPLAKTFFMAAIILEAISLLGVLLPLVKLLFGNKWQFLSYSLVCLFCYLLLLIGAVSEDWFFMGHFIIATLFFILESFFLLFISLFLLLIQKSLVPRFYSLLGLAVFLFHLLYLITRGWFYRAYTQRIAMFLPLVFVFLLGFELLVRKKKLIVD